MKNQLLVLVTCLLFTPSLKAQEDANPPEERDFQYGGIGNLNFSYTSYGDYYSGGGLGNISVGTLIDLYSTSKVKNKGDSKWDNNLRIDYGMVQIENTNNEEFTKSSDNFDFVSKYGTPFQDSDKWFYSLALNFQTQLTDTRTAFDENKKEFSQLIGQNGEQFGTVQSTFFAPADISLGVGIEYKPSKEFSVFMGPISGKMRTIHDEDIAKSGLFGNEVMYNDNNEIIDFRRVRWEAGANVISHYKQSFLEKDRLSVSTNIRLFSNYLDKPENIDVNWNTITSLNPWKFISINYSTNLAYDDNKTFTAFANGEEIEEGPRKGVQFRNVLGIGMTYKINEKLKKKKIDTENILFVSDKS